MRSFLISFFFLLSISLLSLESVFAAGDPRRDGFGTLGERSEAAPISSSAGGTTSGGTGGTSGGSQGGGGNEVPQAVKDFVMPTNSFSMGGLCVGNSCGLELGTGSSNDVIWRGIRVIASIAGTFAILLYIVGAFFLISSQGDENQLNKGKTIVIYTSLGLVHVFGAYIIVQFVLALIFSN